MFPDIDLRFFALVGLAAIFLTSYKPPGQSYLPELVLFTMAAATFVASL